MRFIQLVEESESFEYRPKGTDAVFTLRRISADRMDEIQRTHQKIDFRRGGRLVYVPEDEVIEVNKDLWDYLIVGWKGVVGQDGEPVACTRDNKWKLPGSIKVELLEICDEANLSGLRREGVRPNSSASSSGG